MYSDKTLTCADCGQQFVFSASEQDFYAQRNFSEPRRCASCRASRKAARQTTGAGVGGGRDVEQAGGRRHQNDRRGPAKPLGNGRSHTQPPFAFEGGLRYNKQAAFPARKPSAGARPQGR